ncbi:CZB domain-containing protein [Meiothermus granaticius]|uniref:Chemoreceptor zinc-binding domain protein n=1 Tax=Meiothermus granaticius NBRC 107808 TaxID=1227551 RepID=A0A399FBS6_9DEIN|nr:CZB domain-containing protein [Meiothermus granaticius]RIH93126.1 Chemoreceptor zinc-binding domain protein [Meiothermus granaticius NBRC 107808]GEM88017.1 hypothetical protein MGR01S_26420 [Meiothermus granaticius NBRC 107808]
MSITGWLQGWLRGGSPKPLLLSEQERHFQGLDVQAVLEAHLAWRKRLEDAIQGRLEGELDLSVIVRDNVCQLGQWIYGPAKYSLLTAHPEFADLREAHRRFHLTAARVVQTLRLQGLEPARRILEGEFDQHSKAIVQNLALLMEKERSLSP